MKLSFRFCLAQGLCSQSLFFAQKKAGGRLLATLSILGTNEPALKVTDMSPSLAEDPEVYYGEKTEASSSGSLTGICDMSWGMQ